MPTVNLSHLDHPFTEEELWEVIRSLPADKSPSLDGRTAEFYQSTWSLIKQDLLLAVNALKRLDIRGFHGLNNAFITLLPKRDEATTAADFRPICLIHSFTKIFAKMMARRLTLEIGNLIEVNQSAFIKHRSIHDNFKLVQATAKAFQNCKMLRLLLKLGIAKAFDTVA